MLRSHLYLRTRNDNGIHIHTSNDDCDDDDDDDYNVAWKQVELTKRIFVTPRTVLKGQRSKRAFNPFKNKAFATAAVSFSRKTKKFVLPHFQGSEGQFVSVVNIISRKTRQVHSIHRFIITLDAGFMIKDKEKQNHYVYIP